MSDILIPNEPIGAMIDDGDFAKAGVLMIDIAMQNNNGVQLSDSVLLDTVNIDAETIQKYRDEIKKDLYDQI